MCHQHRFKDLLKQADNLILIFTCAVLLTHNIFATCQMHWHFLIMLSCFALTRNVYSWQVCAGYQWTEQWAQKYRWAVVSQKRLIKYSTENQDNIRVLLLYSTDEYVSSTTESNSLHCFCLWSGLAALWWLSTCLIALGIGFLYRYRYW